ncbi:FxsB family radical SAM/SPASM domain protein [Planotetraspora sp. A-T 1434]|uniref:FxsB family cyclophane-forming radical SAM/SPASM peptide maturase n=1 Tax=Planotetraspora sp. A-T 1434 TaxID=2979219 RepID=UPI0021C166FE|nr:FxsB family cyclophane-forming radical SAM/SPASM peptide maturase [Planotetraspora sp. A-T 1434]MCT9934232.1 FxsB family radical SAM/SPASM domain protein [Planotetraspora sp. A-T 1434]
MEWGGASGILPFRQFVLKVHSRCDLACDHCYVYEHADQSWRGRPKMMSSDTIVRTAERIAEHVRRHDLKQILVVMHGGEPLLAGPDVLAEVATELRGRISESCDLDLRIHTNGILLDDRFCDTFAAQGITVGVSLDGDRLANDRHRRYADGRTSYPQAVRAVERLRRQPELYAGLLCTIDVANDPIAVYEALVALRPPRIDFLLPHATWDAPPPRPSATAYADWLITIFDRWEADGRPVAVRLFDSIIATTWGGASLTEAIGLEPSNLIVIETDGSYELVDSLKVVHDGAPATGHHVANESLDEVAAHPGVRARQGGLESLAAACRACPVVTSCGGGLYTHRYRAGSFDNPSVFCADLFKLIVHVREGKTVRAHALPYDAIDAIAGGFGEARDVGLLMESQQSLRRALIVAVRAKAADETAWELLTRVEEDRPEMLDAVLAHPYIRVWAIGCLEGGGGPAHLANVAAAAAVRAGLDARLQVEVVDGRVHLPTAGTLTGVPGDAATLVIENGRVRLDGQAATWHPVRHLTSGGFSVLLEDSDPYRDCHQWRPLPRLSDAEAALWQESFDQAWQLIERDFPSYATGLSAGLTTIVPLTAADSGHDVSSAARHAFGAVAAALPPDPATFALLIIHEFQHVKLGAVLDMFDLYDETDRRLFHAPWREDLRPLEGLLQGTYAHLAVTDFWRTRRHIDPEPAQSQFAHWRAQTAEAIETLAESKALTPLGERFVRRMRDSIAPWLDEEISEAAGAVRAGG